MRERYDHSPVTEMIRSTSFANNSSAALPLTIDNIINEGILHACIDSHYGGSTRTDRLRIAQAAFRSHAISTGDGSLFREGNPRFVPSPSVGEMSFSEGFSSLPDRRHVDPALSFFTTDQTLRM